MAQRRGAVPIMVKDAGSTPAPRFVLLKLNKLLSYKIRIIILFTPLTRAGTGKTFMAFQIIYRLWKAGIKKKILFLADRNVLVDQTISGDFKPFGGGKMTKVENKQLDSSYEIYLALYQQLAGDDGVEPFKQFKG